MPLSLRSLKKRAPRSLVAAASLGLSITATSAMAASYDILWDGGGDGISFEDANNWGEDYVPYNDIPGLGDRHNAHILNGAVVKFKNAAVVDWVSVYGGASADSILNIEGDLSLTNRLNAGTWNTGPFAGIINQGAVTVAAPLLQVGGSDAGSEGAIGKYNLSAGGTLKISGDAQIGGKGIGTLTNNGGDVNIGGTLWLGIESTGTGTYIQNAGTLSVSNQMRVGDRGTGYFELNGGSVNVSQLLHVGINSTGTFTQQPGSTVVANQINPGWGVGSSGFYHQAGGDVIVNDRLMLGWGETAIGRYEINSGTLNVNGRLDVGLNDGGGSPYGEFRQTGGDVTVHSAFVVSTNGAAQGLYEMSGGTLTVSVPDSANSGNWAFIGQSGTGTFKLSGGIASFGTRTHMAGSGGHGIVEQSGGVFEVTQQAMFIGDGDGLADYTIQGAGGELRTAPGIPLFVGSWHSTGNLNLRSAAALVNSGGNLLIGGPSNEGIPNQGHVAQFGGQVIVAGDLIMADHTGADGGGGGGATNTGLGTYDLRSGSLDVSGWGYVGNWGTGKFNQSGGVAHFAQRLVLAQNANATGDYAMNGGNLNIGGGLFVGENGLGSFNLNNGAVDVGGVGVDDTGWLHVGHNAGSIGTLDVHGGSLAVHSYMGIARFGGSSGIYRQDGGNVQIDGWVISGDGIGSHAEFHQTGGTFHTSGDFVVASWDNRDAIATVDGTADLRVDGAMRIGHGDTGSGVWAEGSLVQSGGQITTTNMVIGEAVNSVGHFALTGGTTTATNWMVLGNQASSYGEMGMSGGLLNVGGGHYIVGDQGRALVIQSGGDVVAGGMRVGDNAGSSGAYELQNGTVTINEVGPGDEGWFHIGHNAGAAGTFNMSGGTLNVNTTFGVGRGGAGTFTQSGGTVNANGWTILVGDGIASDAHYDISGGVTTSAGSFIVASWDANNSTASVSGNGELHVAADIIIGNGHDDSGIGDGVFAVGQMSQSGNAIVTGNQLILGAALGSSGTYKLAGGTLKIAGNELIGNRGHGTVEQSAGDHLVGGSLALGLADNSGATGLLDLTGGTLQVVGDAGVGVGIGSTGTAHIGNAAMTVGGNMGVGVNGLGVVHQDGGSLTIGNTLALGVGNLDPAALGIYNLNGGTLSAPAMITLSGTGLLNINADTTNPLISQLLVPAISITRIDVGQAAFAKLNMAGRIVSANLIRIAGAGFPAEINVSGGDTTAGLIVVQDLGILSGETSAGSLTGDVVVTTGGKIVPGNSPGVLTINGNLSLGENSAIDFEIGTDSDLIRVSGDLAFVNPPISLNIIDSGGFGDGTYTLIKYGSFSGDLTNVGTPVCPIGFSCTIVDSGSSIDLSVVGGTLPDVVWDVDGGGSWGVPGNWLNPVVPDGPGKHARFLEGPPHGLFHAATAHVTLDGNRTVGLIQFANSIPGASYSIDGPGILTINGGGFAGPIGMDVISGHHSINTIVHVIDDATASIAAGSSLSITDLLRIAPGKTLTKIGDGALAASQIDGGRLDVSAGKLSARLLTPSILVVRSGATASINAGAGSTSVVDQLVFDGALGAWHGTLDLSDNDLVVQASAGNGAAILAQVTDQIRQARNSGLPITLWAGEGVTSTAAAADATGITSLGVIQNGQDGITPRADFNGVAVNADSVLVKYTYNGDADLTGTVDADDYFRIDNAFAAGGLFGWANGDFDYSGGSPDADDYFLIDSAFSVQGGPLGISAVAVPEPAGIYAGIMILAYMSRRRRNSWRDEKCVVGDSSIRPR